MELEVKKLNALRKYTGDFGFEYSPDVKFMFNTFKQN